MTHDHDHADHTHGAGGHTHSVSADADGRYLTIALLLIVGFMAFEVVVGIVAHSLALLSDAAHMLTDAGALALSLVVLRPAGRQAASVVPHLEANAPLTGGDPDLHGGGVGVPCDVGQCLLQRAEQRQLRLGRERRQ